MVSQCTKFEVSKFTRYEAMNGGSTAENVVWFGAVMGHSRSSVMSTSFFDFNRNHASIQYRFRDIAGYLWKVADFDPPHLHLVPPQGVTPVEFRGHLWHEKTRVPGVSFGVVYVILRERQTDGQKDRRTQGRGYYRGCIASRGKNVKSCFWILKKNVKTVKYAHRGLQFH